MPSKEIIKRAIKVCQENPGEYKMVAILYKGGSIIRIAQNNDKYIQYRRKYFDHGEPSRHAEMNAIHSMPRDVISGCSMLVMRLDSKDRIKSAKPCLACAKALCDSGIKKVFYSSYSGKILKLDFKNVHNKAYVKEHFCDFNDYIKEVKND